MATRKLYKFPIKSKSLKNKAQLLRKHAVKIVRAQKKAALANMDFCVEFYNNEKIDANVIYFNCNTTDQNPVKLRKAVFILDSGKYYTLLIYYF